MTSEGSRTFSSEIWLWNQILSPLSLLFGLYHDTVRCNQEWLNELFVLSSKKPFMPRWRQLKALQAVIIVIVILIVTVIVIAIVISVFICHICLFCADVDLWSILSLFCQSCPEKGCTHWMQCITLWDEKSCWPQAHLWLCVGWTTWLALKSRYVQWSSL